MSPVRSPPTCTRGATALELAVVLLVFAILAGLTVPMLSSLRQRAALSAAANQIMVALHYARSLAITRGIPVGMCQTSDGERCVTTAGQPSKGFMVFLNLDSDQPAQRDPSEEIMRRFDIAPTLELRGTRSSINYWPAPRASTTVTFSLCDLQRAAPPRAVIVSQTGRPRLARESAGGSSIDCP